MQTSGSVDRLLLLGTSHDSARHSLLPLDLGISLLDFGRSLVCHSLSFRVAGSHARQPKVGRSCPEGQ